MIKKIALTVATAATLSVLGASPASADKVCQPGALGCGGSNTQSIPEPTTVFGTLAVGGGLITKKIADARTASK